MRQIFRICSYIHGEYSRTRWEDKDEAGAETVNVIERSRSRGRTSKVSRSGRRGSREKVKPLTAFIVPIFNVYNCNIIHLRYYSRGTFLKLDIENRAILTINIAADAYSGFERLFFFFCLIFSMENF